MRLPESPFFREKSNKISIKVSKTSTKSTIFDNKKSPSKGNEAIKSPIQPPISQKKRGLR